jgi:hypothetical protein
MIRDFDQLKAQLTELASVVNLFKSEAVQLRVVELVLTGAISEDRQELRQATTSSTPPRKPSGKATRRKAKAPSAVGGDAKKKKGRTVGPATMLAEMIAEKYFAERHTINDMIGYCSSQKARNFKASEFSPALARFVRNGQLKREKNADGQYEYFQP